MGKQNLMHKNDRTAMLDQHKIQLWWKTAYHFSPDRLRLRFGTVRYGLFSFVMEAFIIFVILTCTNEVYQQTTVSSIRIIGK